MSVPKFIAPRMTDASSASVIPLLRPQVSLLPTLQTPCLDCHLRDRCLPSALPDKDLHLLDGLVMGRRRVRSGQHVYFEGDRFRNLYAVYRGSFKSAVVIHDRRDQVTGFSLPGDLLGLDGVANQAHASTATTLEDSEVCVIPFDALHTVAAESSKWQDAMCKKMSEEIFREHAHLLVLGSAGTDARLAVFLMQMSDRMKARGFSPTDFNLRMSRDEIGSYLGLSLETVSRTLSSFQKRGVLDVRKRSIHILKIDEVRQLRHGTGQ
jgi:CRP/FNR family transcriptional regulator, anaerobic regulatory protein